MRGAVIGHGGMRRATVASLVLHAVVVGALLDGSRRMVAAPEVLADLEVVMVVEPAAPAPSVAPPTAKMSPAVTAVTVPIEPPPAATSAVGDVVPATPQPPIPMQVQRAPAPPITRPPGPAGTVPFPAPALAAPPGPDPVEVAADWRAALVAWVQAHKSYPRAAQLRGIEGVVAVRVTVDPSGQVRDVTIEESSGSELLDGVVRRMFEGAQVPPFPPGMARAARTEPLRVGFALQQGG